MSSANIEWGWAYYLEDGSGPIGVVWNPSRATADAHFVIQMLDSGYFGWLEIHNEGKTYARKIGRSADTTQTTRRPTEYRRRKRGKR